MNKEVADLEKRVADLEESLHLMVAFHKQLNATMDLVLRQQKELGNDLKRLLASTAAHYLVHTGKREN